MKNPPHPGRRLRDGIDALGPSVAEAANGLGVTRQQLYRVVSGESGIKSEMAFRLEQVLGSTADFWLRLQANYDLAQVRQRASDIKVHRLVRPEPA